MTDNFLQYQDSDPAPSFSLSSTLHSNLPTSSVSAISNSAASKFNNKNAPFNGFAPKLSKNVSFSVSSSSSKLVGSLHNESHKVSLPINISPADSQGLESLKLANLPSVVGSRLTIQPNGDSTATLKERHKMLMPTDFRSNSPSKTSTTDNSYPVDAENGLVTEKNFINVNFKEPSTVSSIDDYSDDDLFVITDLLNNPVNSLTSSNNNTTAANDTTHNKVANNTTIAPTSTTSTSSTTTESVVKGLSHSKQKAKRDEDIRTSSSNRTGALQATTQPSVRQEKQFFLRTNLKPIAELSPNASYVRILSRQLKNGSADIQAIKSIKRLKLRPMTLPRKDATDFTTQTATVANVAYDIDDNSIHRNIERQSGLNPKPYRNITRKAPIITRPKRLPILKRFYKKNKSSSLNNSDKSESSQSSVSVDGQEINNELKVSDKSTATHSDASFSIKPSYRLTSRLSSNHPAAKVQSISNKSPRSPKFPLRNFRNQQQSRFGLRSNPRTKIRLPPPKIDIKLPNVHNKPIRNRFKNFRRERLTESPNKLSISPTEDPKSVVSSTTVSPDTSATLVEQQKSVESVFGNNAGDDDVPTTPAIEEDNEETVTEPQTEPSTTQRQTPASTTQQVTEASITTQQQFLNIVRPTLPSIKRLQIATTPVTERSFRNSPTQQFSSRSTVEPPKSFKLYSTTTSTDVATERIPLTTTPKKISKLLSSIKRKRLKEDSNVSGEPKEGKKIKLTSAKVNNSTDQSSTHPLLANLRNKFSSITKVNNSKSGDENDSSKNLSLKEKFKIETATRGPLSIKHVVTLPSISGSTSFTASTFTPSKPSAGRLGHFFPKPRSDAVLLRYVIDCVSKHTMPQ